MKKTGILAVSIAAAVSVAAALTIGLCFAFGGANHEHTFSQDWSSDATDHWHAATCGHEDATSDKEAHTLFAGKCTVCGYEQECTLTENTDFIGLVSDRVTEEEWKAIYSEEKFKNVTVRETRGDIEGADDQRGKMYLDWEETRLSLKGRFNMMSVGTIPTPDGDYNTLGGQLLEDGICTEYRLYDQQPYYTQYEMTQEQLAELEQYMMYEGEYSFFYATLIVTDFSDYYEQFTYNEELGAYLYEAPEGSDGLRFEFTAFDGMGTYLKYVELKFKEGRVAYVHWKSFHYRDLENGETEEIVTDIYDCYYDYGRTKVVPPENAKPDSERS